MAELEPVDTKISAVTVLQDRARIIRVGQGTLPAGQSVVTVANLPMSLQADSVRVKGAGHGVRILGIDVAVVQFAVTPDGNAAELQARIEELEGRLRQDADAAAIQQDRLKTVAAIRANAAADVVKGIARGRSSVESLDGLIAYADREEAACRAAIQAHADTTRDLMRQLDALRARLRQLQAPASVQRRTLTIAVEADAAETAFSFEVSYVCSGAHWRPLYDMRLTGDTVRVSYLAMVTQNTGEDWPEASLSLSTARTAALQTVPELLPWYVDLYVPPPPSPVAMARPRGGAALGGGGAAEFGTMAAPSMAMAMAPAPAPPPEARQMDAVVERQGSSATFGITRKTSIPSDNTPHRTQIAEFDLPAKLDYIAAPKLAEQAYLRATVRNESDFVLLPGKANLFHGDDFVGTTVIEDTAAREFELQLGVDERLTIHRELLSRDVSKTFIGGSRRLVYAYKIEVEHRLQESAVLTLLDQIPQSRHEEIKVKLIDANPKPVEVTDLGELRWKITLESGKAAVVRYEFSVEYPKAQSITGMRE